MEIVPLLLCLGQLGFVRGRPFLGLEKELWNVGLDASSLLLQGADVPFGDDLKAPQTVQLRPVLFVHATQLR